MLMKRTLVLLVERTIAATAAERMRLRMALTDTGHQNGDGTEHIARERTRKRMYLLRVQAVAEGAPMCLVCSGGGRPAGADAGGGGEGAGRPATDRGRDCLVPAGRRCGSRVAR